MGIPSTILKLYFLLFNNSSKEKVLIRKVYCRELIKSSMRFNLYCVVFNSLLEEDPAAISCWCLWELKAYFKRRIYEFLFLKRISKYTKKSRAPTTCVYG